MGMTEYKVGDKLRPKTTSSYASGEVVSIGRVGGVASYWVRYTYTTGVEGFLTFREHAMDRTWELAPQFFEVGKVYRFKDEPGVTHKVLDIYQVDNPLGEDERVAAVAVATNSSGKQYIHTLVVRSFNYMETVR